MRNVRLLPIVMGLIGFVIAFAGMLFFVHEGSEWLAFFSGIYATVAIGSVIYYMDGERDA